MIEFWNSNDLENTVNPSLKTGKSLKFLSRATLGEQFKTSWHGSNPPAQQYTRHAHKRTAGKKLL